MPSFRAGCSTDQMGPLLLQIEDSSNFISKKLLPICDSSGVAKDKVAVSCCPAGAFLPCRSLWLACERPASKARQGPVVYAACQLYAAMFMHPLTRAVPQGPSNTCCSLRSEAPPLANTLRQ